MNKKYFGMLLSVALVAGCASTQTTQETKEPDQEEVYIPVEQVWPEIPQPRISATTKANAGKVCAQAKIIVKSLIRNAELFKLQPISLRLEK